MSETPAAVSDERIGGLWLTLADCETAGDAVEKALAGCAEHAEEEGESCGCSARFAALEAKLGGAVALPVPDYGAAGAAARGRVLLGVSRALSRFPEDEEDTAVADAVADLLFAVQAAGFDPHVVAGRALRYLEEEDGGGRLEAVPCPQCGPGALWRLELEEIVHTDVAGFRRNSGGGLVAVVDEDGGDVVDQPGGGRVVCVKCGAVAGADDWEYGA